MKTIPAKELQTNLDALLTASQNDRIVILREGQPCPVLIGIQDYDAENLELATSPDFWLMIEQRRSEGNSIPLAEVEARLGTRPGKAPSRRAAPKKSRKQK
jgi:PHD/YefM family antitoxin component YafN of YafNO toxin-antitoxin module